MNRFEEIAKNVIKSQVIADVGCDHGYVSEKILNKGLASTLIISDVSAKCLNKAEILLDKYVKQGIVKPIVSDGFEKYTIYPDQAIIAGMGGEETIKILGVYKPSRLVLQPMKNVDKLRVFLVENGYKILKDYTFFGAGKFYDIIVATNGKDTLTENEIKFGRTNLLEKSEDFINKWKNEIRKINVVINGNVNDKLREKLNNEIKKIEKIIL